MGHGLQSQLLTGVSAGNMVASPSHPQMQLDPRPIALGYLPARMLTSRTPGGPEAVCMPVRARYPRDSPTTGPPAPSHRVMTACLPHGPPSASSVSRPQPQTLPRTLFWGVTPILTANTCFDGQESQQPDWGGCPEQPLPSQPLLGRPGRRTPGGRGLGHPHIFVRKGNGGPEGGSNLLEVTQLEMQGRAGSELGGSPLGRALPSPLPCLRLWSWVTLNARPA